MIKLLSILDFTIQFSTCFNWLNYCLKPIEQKNSPTHGYLLFNECGGHLSLKDHLSPLLYREGKVLTLQFELIFFYGFLLFVMDWELDSSFCEKLTLKKSNFSFLLSEYLLVLFYSTKWYYTTNEYSYDKISKT